MGHLLHFLMLAESNQRTFLTSDEKKNCMEFFSRINKILTGNVVFVCEIFFTPILNVKKYDEIFNDSHMSVYRKMEKCIVI